MAGKQFGGKLTPELIERYSRSENWKDGVFQNRIPTDMRMSLASFPKILYKQIAGRKSRNPTKKLAVAPFDREAFMEGGDEPTMIWYGHSALLLRMNGKVILIDPMLGPDCTPFTPFKTARFTEDTLALIDDFPEIDLLLLSHDHYDHLDKESIDRLQQKVKQYFVALGVGRHLESWGVSANVITEFDWWDTASIDGLTITFTPTRHFAGRGLRDRFKSLWGGWVLKDENKTIWFSGDGGYGAHFKEVGERLGPFDFAFMECGQYNDYWHEIHLFPDESVRAAIEAHVKRAMPVHWAGFPLSFQHKWHEPADLFFEHANEQGLAVSFPQIGKVFTIDSPLAVTWWEDM